MVAKSPLYETLPDSYNRSINSIPENITYFYRDDSLESTRGARFRVNSVNSRLWVIDIAPSNTPEALRDRQVEDLGLVRCWTSLDLDS